LGVKSPNIGYINDNIFSQISKMLSLYSSAMYFLLYVT